jgi:hypothetical protein
VQHEHAEGSATWTAALYPTGAAQSDEARPATGGATQRDDADRGALQTCPGEVTVKRAAESADQDGEGELDRPGLAPDTGEARVGSRMYKM